MNIKLTNKEASEIIKAHFFREAHPSVVLNIQSIEIESADSVYSNKKTVELAPLIQAIRDSSPPFGGSNKIAAIKAVRSELRDQGFEGGLADLKLFVEQFIP